MKKCFKCGKEKPLDAFYKHPGMADKHLNKCKECTKKDFHGNYSKNHEYYIEYDKLRNQLPHRIEARKIYSLEHPDIFRANADKWRKKNPAKKRAQYLLNNAIRDKRISKKLCEFCGENKVQGHHYDYSKPLDVIWLCSSCHNKLHKILKLTVS
jgi:hypothetical protein